MPRLDDAFPAILEALVGRYGRAEPSGAATEPFEALVETLLGRALDPRKVRPALDALRDGGLLDPESLAESDPAEAADALRVAGLTIAERTLVPLRRVARWLVESHQGAAGVLAGPDGAVSTEQLREELVALNGIGQGTADALLLHALGRPVYPLDRATYRVLIRHGWADTTADYDEARDPIERQAGGDPATLATLAHAFERLGREFCRAGAPKCEKCPLRPWLPDGGPLDPAG